MNEQAVFVYGTLRRGGSNHYRMAGSEFLGAGSIEGFIYLIDWNPQLIYPALVLENGGRVMGELYQVSSEMLGELDIFEGIGVDSWRNDEYLRVRTEVQLDDGGKDEGWVWVWNQSVGKAAKLENGDWLAHEPNPS